MVTRSDLNAYCYSILKIPHIPVGIMNSTLPFIICQFAVFKVWVTSERKTENMQLNNIHAEKRHQPARMPRNRHILSSILIVSLASGLSKINGVMTELFFVMVMLASVHYYSSMRRISKKEAMATVAIISMGAIVTAIEAINGTEVSLWQVARTSIWAFVYIFMLIAGKRLFFGIDDQRLLGMYSAARTLTIMVCGLVLLDLALGLNMAPAAIRVEGTDISQQRIYIVASSALAPLFFLYLWKKDYVPLVAVTVMIFATQGKIMMAAIPAALILLAFKRPKTGLLIIALLIPVAVYLFPTSRIVDFIDGGDIQRLRQINEALAAYTTNIWRIVVGAGHGTPYSEGYAQFGQINPDQANLYENTRFDVENGFVYLLLRFGVIGFAVFFALTVKAIDQKYTKRAFIVNTLIMGAGSSFFGAPGGIFFVTCFLFASEMMNRNR